MGKRDKKGRNLIQGASVGQTAGGIWGSALPGTSGTQHRTELFPERQES